MAELLLEIFCEEIPARMQAKAEADLEKALVAGLKVAGLEGTSVTSLSGPRRLAVAIDGLAERSADVEEERKGPKVGAPDKAVEGFMRGAGLSSIDEAQIRSDPKKGDFYIAIKKIAGRNTKDVVAELVPEIVRGFHWPKSMRWGRGDLRWVRPLQRIVCVFDGAVVPFEIDGLASGNETEGHRVHGRGSFKVSGLKDYRKQLEGKGHVRLSRADRRDLIETQAKKVCADKGLELVDDRGLLEEVTGLAEWPVVILGEMEPSFLELPPEVIQLSMRTHQKYFAVRDPKTGDLAPHFVVVANIEAKDGGKKIAEGNSRVLSARLSDGQFFYTNDIDANLATMGEKLSTIQFKAELGSIADKVDRVSKLARGLAPMVKANPDLAERAAQLCKADLVSDMVYEFPELQGVMGRYYAIEAGEDAAVADAIRDHYKPQGPSDAVPTEPVSIAVALADKLDTLTGFWAIDEKPTGSKDPFALRRAALGVVRLILENGLRLSLRNRMNRALEGYWGQMYCLDGRNYEENVSVRKDAGWSDDEIFDLVKKAAEKQSGGRRNAMDQLQAVWTLLDFFADRLKQYLRDQGQRHDLIDAVFVLGKNDLFLIVKRVEALGAFLETDDGTNLLAGYKRAANILKAEAKKDALPDNLSVDGKLAEAGPAEERALYAALMKTEKSLKSLMEKENFTGAMSELAGLRAPVDAFFDNVMVNDKDDDVRTNRLALLEQIRTTIHRVADFEKIEG